MRVVFAHERSGPPPGVPEYLIGLLDDLGYRGSAKPYGRGEDPSNEAQMLLSGWGPDYPAAQSFFSGLVTCHDNFFDEAFCEPRIDRMIDEATQAQLEDPGAAVQLWAKVDRALVDQAPNLWFVNPIEVQFVSSRVGNYQWSFQQYALLNQIWVR